jgi:hypothetical protein
LGQARVEDDERDRYVPLDVFLLDVSVAPVDRRWLVMAIGSNGAPDVLRRKFVRAGVRDVVPFITANLSDIAVGHSAHVSVAGYVAAAPFASPGATTPVVVSLLDAEQLRCLDDTEPNYRRRLVSGEHYALTVDVSGEQPESFLLYESKWGVLARRPGDATPLPLGTQQQLLYVLAAGDAALRPALHRGQPPGRDGRDAGAVLAELAAGEDRREAVRARLGTMWALESGIVHVDDPLPPTYGQTGSR